MAQLKEKIKIGNWGHRAVFDCDYCGEETNVVYSRFRDAVRNVCDIECREKDKGNRYEYLYISVSKSTKPFTCSRCGDTTIKGSRVGHTARGARYFCHGCVILLSQYAWVKLYQ